MDLQKKHFSILIFLSNENMNTISIKCFQLFSTTTQKHLLVIIMIQNVVLQIKLKYLKIYYIFINKLRNPGKILTRFAKGTWAFDLYVFVNRFSWRTRQADVFIIGVLLYYIAYLACQSSNPDLIIASLRNSLIIRNYSSNVPILHLRTLQQL